MYVMVRVKRPPSERRPPPQFIKWDDWPQCLRCSYPAGHQGPHGPKSRQ